MKMKDIPKAHIYKSILNTTPIIINFYELCSALRIKPKNVIFVYNGDNPEEMWRWMKAPDKNDEMLEKFKEIVLIVKKHYVERYGKDHKPEKKIRRRGTSKRMHRIKTVYEINVRVRKMRADLRIYRNLAAILDIPASKLIQGNVPRRAALKRLLSGTPKVDDIYLLEVLEEYTKQVLKDRLLYGEPRTYG